MALDDLEVSPDGRRIAFIYQNQGHRALAVYERKSGAARQVMFAKDGDVVDCTWKGNDHLLVFADFVSGAIRRVMLADLTTQAVVRLDEKPGFLGVEESRPADPRHILAADFFGVYLYDVFELRKQLMFTRTERRDEVEYNWLADRDGKVRAYFVERDQHVSFMTGDGTKGHYVEVAAWTFDGFGEAGSVGRAWLTGNGRTAYVIAHKDHDRGALFAIDTATGKWSEPVFVPPEGEITGLVFSPDQDRLEGVSYESDRRHYRWFDPQREKLQAWMEKGLPGRDVTLVSESADGRVLVAFAAADRDPGNYYVGDLSTGKLTEFVGRLLDLDSQLLRPMEPIAFTARDGLELHGYLTRPWVAANGPVPLIVVPHDSPYGERNSWGFSREAQFLASRGYAVVQVNYRGSGGYGTDFLKKGRFQWGRAMQDDLTDAVRWLVKQGVADPQRVAILGRGYGGYAALEGTIQAPDLYRCAVNCQGYADLEIAWRPPGTDALPASRYYDYRQKWIGAERLYRDAVSPIRHADRIRVPLLNAYWRDDSGFDWDNWKRLNKALTEAQKPFEFVTTKEYRPYELDWTDASIEYNRKVEAFLAKNLAPLPR
ncbi:MAG TPA: prolyl oligopeptidase family serine peptidase [Opitutus sp.]|nr:prolyl oligopeptidase family serine peptidase [Opitutus sp.]